MQWWSELAQRVRGIDPSAGDIVLAAAVAALALAQFARPAPTGARPADLLGAILLLVLCGLLAARRLRPRTVLVAILATTVLYALAGYPQATLGLPLVIAVYTVGTRYTLRASAGVLALVAATLVVAFASDPGALGAVDMVSTVVTTGGAWWVGAGMRLRREQVALVEERAALREQARHDLAERAVTHERLRIARELHDVVAHSMSVVAVQAGMAEHVLATQPQQAAAALAAISESSRSALQELRRLLGVLRDDDEPAGSLVPALGIDDLPALVERVREAGVAVDLVVEGDRGAVPVGAGLTVYRIVQEALTNTVRHAGPGSGVRVRITGTPQVLDVLVLDDGRGTPTNGADGTGSGLIGMRERVEVFGGSLEAGPVAGGGWRVAARLPFDPPGTRAVPRVAGEAG